MSSCQPNEIVIKACTASERLAFWIEDTDGWFFNSLPRPFSAEIYEPFVQPMWDTQVPHDLIGNALHTYQPKRKIILYGQRFEGWEIRTPAQALSKGKAYHVEIWTDGGRGRLELKAGRELPDCSLIT